MPKEVVHDEVGLYDVTVGWDHGAVQVGISTRDGESIASKLSNLEDDELVRFTGLWGTFNRPNLNRLIQVLRRARNSVYGADE